MVMIANSFSNKKRDANKRDCMREEVHRRAICEVNTDDNYVALRIGKSNQVENLRSYFV